MKNYLKTSIIIVFSLLFINTVLYQFKHFNWTDTTFEIESTRPIVLYTDFQGPCSTKPCYDFHGNNLVYDTIVNFLKNNPNIKIEIGVHSDTRGKKEFNQNLTSREADGIHAVLLKKGVLLRQLKCIGYGETNPIDTLKHQPNNRIEVKIIQNKKPFYIEAIEKDTLIQELYYKQGDLFIIKRDTINNDELDRFAVFCEKLLEQDTSCLLQIHYDAIMSDRYSRNMPIAYDRTARDYLINNYNFDEKIAEFSCLYNNIAYRNSKKPSIYIKIVSKLAYLKCIKESKKTWIRVDRCDNCPF